MVTEARDSLDKLINSINLSDDYVILLDDKEIKDIYWFTSRGYTGEKKVTYEDVDDLFDSLRTAVTVRDSSNATVDSLNDASESLEEAIQTFIAASTIIGNE